MMITAVAVVGNVVWVVLKVCVLRTAFVTPVDILLTNLHVMDLLMGLYSLVVVIADLSYRERYFSVREEWTVSTACTCAGILALVSYMATGLTSCTITLSGLLLTSKARQALSRRQAILCCLLTWSLSLLVTLLPYLLGWQVHGHTDNCIPLAHKVRTFQGRAYLFVFMIVLHLVIALLSAGGQVSLYWLKDTQDDFHLSVTDRSLKMAEATRGSLLVLVDSLRRLAVGVIGTAGFAGGSVPDDINVFFAVFLLPTNAALNPLLYAVSVVTERKRLATEQRLLERLSRMRAQQAPKSKS
ncbi:G-protein coupled receptor GRL101-like [Littorina saxatilis]|uniref:G-protein coupled receptor GRL101-like n=1 Tax=Littorina saxatilis TaxID=31220 RepID=UPI0038B6117F